MRLEDELLDELLELLELLELELELVRLELELDDDDELLELLEDEELLLVRLELPKNLTTRPRDIQRTSGLQVLLDLLLMMTPTFSYMFLSTNLEKNLTMEENGLHLYLKILSKNH